MTRAHDDHVLTKLVATLGPASASREQLNDLLDQGVDVCRLNFSHGDLNEKQRLLEMIRAWESEHERPVAVLGDLCGPKIRLSEVRGGSFEVRAGDGVRIRAGEQATTPAEFHVNYEGVVQQVEVGQRVYIDDGLIRLLVTDRTAEALVCTVTVGGAVSSHKGVNLPDTDLHAPALTEKDRRDLEWAIENDLDYVALSFVRKPDDVRALRRILDEHDAPQHVVIKIEKAEALEHLDELIDLTDAVMVARGDLGVEMDIWRVPLVQKDITRRCRAAGRPVIIATQMLQSMVHNPAPTRAEVSDVANAILDQADAVMLSAESAAGRYPSGAVDMINRVARATEAFQRSVGDKRPADSPHSENQTAVAIARAAVQAALHLDARLVAVWTATGNTARLVAAHRLPMPIVGLTYDDRVYRQLNLLYGVIPIRIEPCHEPARLLRELDDHLLRRGLARSGDVVVAVTSTKPTAPGWTNSALVHRIGEAED